MQDIERQNYGNKLKWVYVKICCLYLVGGARKSGGKVDDYPKIVDKMSYGQKLSHKDKKKRPRVPVSAKRIDIYQGISSAREFPD